MSDNEAAQHPQHQEQEEGRSRPIIPYEAYELQQTHDVNQGKDDQDRSFSASSDGDDDGNEEQHKDEHLPPQEQQQEDERRILQPLALMPLHPACKNKDDRLLERKPLPLVLGRTNLASWWWSSCPCQHYCRLHCRPVAQNIRSLSKVMIQLDSAGVVHMCGKNPHLVTITPERQMSGILTTTADEQAAAANKEPEALQLGDIISFGRKDREPWMRFQVVPNVNPHSTLLLQQENDASAAAAMAVTSSSAAVEGGAGSKRKQRSSADDEQAEGDAAVAEQEAAPSASEPNNESRKNGAFSGTDKKSSSEQQQQAPPEWIVTRAASKPASAGNNNQDVNGNKDIQGQDNDNVSGLSAAPAETLKVQTQRAFLSKAETGVAQANRSKPATNETALSLARRDRKSTLNINNNIDSEDIVWPTRKRRRHHHNPNNPALSPQPPQAATNAAANKPQKVHLLYCDYKTSAKELVRWSQRGGGGGSAAASSRQPSQWQAQQPQSSSASSSSVLSSGNGQQQQLPATAEYPHHSHQTAAHREHLVSLQRQALDQNYAQALQQQQQQQQQPSHQDPASQVGAPAKAETNEVKNQSKNEEVLPDQQQDEDHSQELVLQLASAGAFVAGATAPTQATATIQERHEDDEPSSHQLQTQPSTPSLDETKKDTTKKRPKKDYRHDLQAWRDMIEEEPENSLRHAMASLIVAQNTSVSAQGRRRNEGDPLWLPDLLQDDFEVVDEKDDDDDGQQAEDQAEAGAPAAASSGGKSK